MHVMGFHTKRSAATAALAGMAIAAVLSGSMLGLATKPVGAGFATGQASDPPYAPDAYEPAAREAPASPVLAALNRGDLHAATRAVLEPREAIVQLHDGQRFTGFLVERTPERVILKIAGIDTPIRGELIDRVMVLPPVRERYLSMRAAIEPDDTRGLLLLVEWLRAREQWDLALYEVDQVLASQPGEPEAQRLRLLIISQRDLAERARARAAERERAIREEPGEADAGERDIQRPVRRPQVPPDHGEGDDFPLLSDHQINLIKVFETHLGNPPRLVIDRGTITRLITEYADDPNMPATREQLEALYRASPARVLDLMFRVRARDLYSEVKVLDQPAAMRHFRDDLHRSWIINSCATTRCHGGTEAGRLRLHNRRPGSDPTVYTNFLILERFRLADGTALINYDDPPKSPLLQMALPREDSQYPHPPVPSADGRGDQWRPALRSVSDRRFKEATRWVMSMYRPRPDYPIEYTPPALQAGPRPPPVER